MRESIIGNAVSVAPPVPTRGWALLCGATLGVGLHFVLSDPWAGATGLGRAALLGALLVAAAEADLRAGRIPNGLVLGAAVIAAGLLALGPVAGLGDGVLGALVGGGLLLAFRAFGLLVFGRPGMGMGDVKLAVALGLLIGLDILWALYLAIVAGGLAAAAVLVVRGRTPGAILPFAPFIAAGALVGVYVMPFQMVLKWVI